MKKLSKCSLSNLKLIGEVIYNITGLEYYLNLTSNYYQSAAMCGSYRGHFFDFYFENLKLLKKLINKGETFNYPLCKLDGTIKPYIFNSI